MVGVAGVGWGRLQARYEKRGGVCVCVCGCCWFLAQNEEREGGGGGGGGGGGCCRFLARYEEPVGGMIAYRGARDIVQ